MNILSFLLPNTILDWFFFSLLIGWTCVALYAAKQSKSTLDVRINSSHFKNIKSSVAELSAASRHPIWDHILDNAAGFALVLGLLGTFLGIGLAIQGAGSILADMNSSSATNATDMRQTIGNLSPMLAEIGLKFKSSAWGILTHIILRIAIPAFGIEEKRFHEIFKELERDALEEQQLSQERWTKLESIMQTQLNLAQQMQQTLHEALFIKTAQEGSIAKLLSTQETHLGIIAEVQQGFGKHVKDLGKSVTEFEKTVDAFRGTMKKSLEEMQSSIKNTTEGLQEAVNGMKSEVNTTFTQFKDNVSQTLNKVGEDIASSSLAIKSSVDTLSNSMATELQNVTRVTADLTSHSREMTIAIQEQKHMLEEMGDKVQEIAARGAQYGFALEDVTSHIQKLAGADGAMVKHLETLSNNSEQVIDHTKVSNDFLEKLLNNSRANSQKSKSFPSPFGRSNGDTA